MGIVNFFKNFWSEIEVIKGNKTKDKFYSSRSRFIDRKSAEHAFQISKEKLFHVNNWSRLPGVASKFRAYDANGNIKASGIPVVGDYIFINLPGPSPETWVRVNDIKNGEERAEFTVSPSHDPREKNEKEIEHFFADEATSTFRVELRGNSLIACEIGKKEGINNRGKKAGGKEVVNTLIAVGGWLAFQEIQWIKLTQYLVHKVELEE